MHTHTDQSEGTGISMHDETAGKIAALQLSAFRAALSVKEAATEGSGNRLFSAKVRQKFQRLEFFTEKVVEDLFSLMQSEKDDSYSGLPTSWAAGFHFYAGDMEHDGEFEELAPQLEAFSRGCFWLESSLKGRPDHRVLARGKSAFEYCI